MTAAGRPDAAEVLALLTTLGERGLLRRLDVALARFLHGLADDGVAPEVLLGAALLAHVEGQGHSCWLPAGWLAGEDLEPGADAMALRAALQPLLARLPRDAAAWIQALRDSPVVETRPDATPAATQAATSAAARVLVLEAGRADAPRLYLRRYWQLERQLLMQVRARVADAPAVDDALARLWLDRLCGPVAPGAGVDWQRLACAATLRGRLTLVTGGPGTGKTFTAARALALQFAVHPAPASLRVALAAPTGKAAARLAQSIAQAWAALGRSLASEPAAHAALAEWGRRIGPARTLHALLGARPDTRHWRFDAQHPLPLDVLVVDEASMVHLELMTSLLQALPPQATLILLGDKDQLASVEAGAVLGDLCRGAEAGGYGAATAAALQALTGQALPPAMVASGRPGNAVLQQTVMLRQSRRFGGPIGALAAAVNAGEAAAVQKALRQPGAAGVAVLAPAGQLALGDDPAPDLLAQLVARVLDGVALPAAGRSPGATVGSLRAVYRQVRQGPPARDATVADPDAGAEAGGGADVGAHAGMEAHVQWVHAILAGFEACRVLAALRSGPWGVEGLNQALQQALAREGLIRPGSAAGGWYAGRPVLVTRNDPAAGVFNGDVGLALPGPQGGALRVWFADGDQLRSILASRLAHVETAFAMTVHKSQGSEFAHTVLVLPPRPSPVLSRELLYTGITRARQALTLVLPGAGVLEAALARRTRRASGLVEGLMAGAQGWG